MDRQNIQAFGIMIEFDDSEITDGRRCAAFVDLLQAVQGAVKAGTQGRIVEAGAFDISADTSGEAPGRSAGINPVNQIRITDE